MSTYFLKQATLEIAALIRVNDARTPIPAEELANQNPSNRLCLLVGDGKCLDPLRKSANNYQDVPVSGISQRKGPVISIESQSHDLVGIGIFPNSALKG